MNDIERNEAEQGISELYEEFLLNQEARIEYYEWLDKMSELDGTP